MKTNLYLLSPRSRTLTTGQSGRPLQMKDYRSGTLQTRQLIAGMSKRGDGVQRKSEMSLSTESNMINSTDVISSFDHKRNGGPNSWSRNKAIDMCPYPVQSGMFCNHSRSYEWLCDQLINNRIMNQTAQTAAQAVHGIRQGLIGGVLGDFYQSTIASAENGLPINRTSYLAAMDYYIYHICDYPPNLFFWIDQIGGDPDEPAAAQVADPNGQNVFTQYVAAIRAGRAVVEAAV